MMKKAILIVLTVILSVINVLGQITPGRYRATHDVSNALIIYNLELNTDGSFSFHFFRKNYCDSCVEENKYGRGTWKLERNQLILMTESTVDINEDFVLDLNQSKARLIKKRNSEGQLEEILKFFASDIFWVKGMELIR